MIYKLLNISAGCPYCGSGDVEEFESKNGGTKYYCRDCKTWF